MIFQNPIRHHTQEGFSLVEVMVAMVIFAIGLLGVAALMASNMSYTTSSQYRTQATFMAYDILDRMRVNPDEAIQNNTYSIGIGTNPGAASCYNVACTPSQIAQADLTEWKDALNTLLPGGDGSVTRVVAGGSTLFRVEVVWDESQATEDGGSTIVVRSEL